eukprot:5687634-Pleurochrysis_carterae.AAC.1
MRKTRVFRVSGKYLPRNRRAALYLSADITFKLPYPSGSLTRSAARQFPYTPSQLSRCGGVAGGAAPTTSTTTSTTLTRRVRDAYANAARRRDCAKRSGKRSSSSHHSISLSPCVRLSLAVRASLSRRSGVSLSPCGRLSLAAR